MSRYAYAWEYRVAPADEAAFLERYRPDGSWVQLFRRADGYLETRLLKDLEVAGRYVTVDRWENRQAFDAFRQRFSREFEALDRECEGLTTRESPLGTFLEVDADGS